MAKIMFYAHDPGGKNAITPLFEPLSAEHEVFWSADWKSAPDLIITGTSANDFTEKRLWRDAKARGIKTIAILDHWCNYGVRFSRRGLRDIDKFDKTCEFLPDYIIVMDDFAKKEMVTDGVPAEIIYPLGNPHFHVIARKAQPDEAIRKTPRSLSFVRNDMGIVFASEPYTEDYGHGEEKTVLKWLLEAFPDEKITVKLHPKEALEKYEEFLPQVILDKDSKPADVIAASALVVSMTSMFLLEAMLAGKKIISCRPFAQDKDKFILTRQGILPFINNYEDFAAEMVRILNDKNFSGYNHSIKTECIDEIVNFVNEVLNG